MSNYSSTFCLAFVPLTKSAIHIHAGGGLFLDSVLLHQTNGFVQLAEGVHPFRQKTKVNE